MGFPIPGHNHVFNEDGEYMFSEPAEGPPPYCDIHGVCHSECPDDEDEDDYLGDLDDWDDDDNAGVAFTDKNGTHGHDPGDEDDYPTPKLDETLRTQPPWDGT